MAVWHIVLLTIRETQRRRILWIGLLMGLAFLVVFGLGFHFIYQDIKRSASADLIELPIQFLTMAGLYAANILVVLVSVLVSVATISGEIESHTIESLIMKPIRRSELIIGKWLGFALIILAFVILLPGGVMLTVYLRAGVELDNIAGGLLMIFLAGLAALSVSLAGGTRLSTLANGALAFMLFGIAFIGGWVEQIGAFLRNETAVDLGIVASLLMPSEILWKKASTLFNPEVLSDVQFAGPFALASQPSNAMIIYSLLYILTLLSLAMFLFSRRDL